MTQYQQNPGHSSIRVAPNGRYFLGLDGKPFFWLGDTAWPLFTQYSLADAENFLQDRGRKGFSAIQAVLSWSGGTGLEQPAPLVNSSEHRPWMESPAQPDPAYYEPVEQLLQIAAENSLVIAMLPTWGYFIINKGAFDCENAFTFGHWLGQRFRDQPNLIWVLGGDRLPRACVEVYRSMARGLRAGDNGSHLISYHPCGGYSSSNFFHTVDWLDFNMIQTWGEWTRIYSAVNHDALLAPAKPVVLAEPAYENGPEYPSGPITPLIVRRQAWWTFMAGGFYTYGQDQMWKMDSHWTQTFDTPGACQMSIFRQILAALPWWRLQPDQSLFETGVSSERTLNTAMRSEDGSLALVYLSSQCHVRLHLDAILKDRVHATWINPATGERQDGGFYQTGQAGTAPFPVFTSQWFATPGFWEDAVLLMEGE